MRSSGRLSCAATALTALTTLTACGGGGDDGGAADSTALPHARGSDQASDSTLDQEDPRRFIQRWAAAESRMENTGKFAPYLGLSRGCVSCRQLAHTVAAYFAAGGFVHGGSWHIDSIKAAPSSQGMIVYVVRAHTAPMTVRESSSRGVQHVPGGPVSYLIGLIANGSSFTVGFRTRGG